jgi:para-aminobenzoate synthetase component I
VFDSNSADEFKETLDKGRTLMRALEGSGSADGSSIKLPSAQEQFVWCNGKFKPLSEMSVSFEDEGFAYGYGFFETIRVQNGHPIMLDAHLARFERAWKQFLVVPFPDLTWSDIVGRVIRRNRLNEKTAAVKLLAAAGKPGQADRTMTLLVTAREYIHRLEGRSREGLRLAVYPHRRHSHLADYKTTNYMFQRLAAKWANEMHVDEALILNVDGSVCETNTANLICRIDGKLCRPLSEHVLAGTMEQAVCGLLENWNISVERRKLTVDELMGADNLLLTNSLMGVVPISNIEGKELAIDSELCLKINQALLG